MGSSSSTDDRGATTSRSASAIVLDAVEGWHVLAIEGYSRTKGFSNGEQIKSGTFNVGGHAWYIRYYPEGDDPKNAGWISFFLHLKSSSATKVEARFKFSLLDEMGEPVPSYSRAWGPVQTFKIIQPDQHLGWGYQRFIEKKALEESSYLKDDCFRVRCDIIVSMKCRAEARSSSQKFIDVPPSNLHRHLERLFSSKHGADVTFEVAGETIAAHKYILAARSPVFKAQLFGPLKENTMTHIQIDDDDNIEPKVFRAMLQFIYTDSLPPEIETSDDMLAMAQHLLVVADRYDLERLKLISEDKLCSSIEASTAATTLALAEQHGCRGLKEACLQFLDSRKNLMATMESDGFHHLMTSCPSLIMELLAKGAAHP